MYLEEIQEAVIRGDKAGTIEAVEKALAAGVEAGTILNEAMIPAMAIVGDRFERNEYFVPEMLIAARAMQAGVNLLKPLLVQSGVEPIGKVAIGTVKGDLHDIGKNLVMMMMEGSGFAIKDLGVNTDPEAFVEAAREGYQIIAMSALLTTTMPAMKTTIDAIAEAGLRGSVKIMVGGAPVTQSFADEIGADGYSSDASGAARLAKQLIGAA